MTQRSQPSAKRASPGEEDFLDTVRRAGLPLPDREFMFFDGRRWRFDFAWPALKIAVEIEGGQWVGGHTTKGRFDSDAEKYNAATMTGWAVYRFTPEMVRTGRAFQVIVAAIDNPAAASLVFARRRSRGRSRTRRIEATRSA